MADKFTLYSSRSAIETGLDCLRKRFFQYHYPNKKGELVGITKATPNYDLEIGTSCHKGVAFLLENIKNDSPLLLEEAVGVAKGYFIYKFPILYKNKDLEVLDNLDTIEGLVRVYYYTEFQSIKKYYNVVFIEKEISKKIYKNSFDLVSNIIFQGTSDSLLESKENGDLFNYSLKTAKLLWSKTENSYKVDLQGLTETILVEDYLKRLRVGPEEIIKNLDKLDFTYLNQNNIEKFKKYLNSSVEKIPTRLMGIKFCFLLKGREIKEDIPFDTKERQYKSWDNYFINGFRNRVSISITDFAFADKIEKKENKSGFGKLGKGWERIKIRDQYKGGLKQWVEDIFAGKIQKVFLDDFKNQCLSLPEVFRNKEQLEDAWKEIVENEIEWYEKLEPWVEDNLYKGNDNKNIIDSFRKNRKRCFYPLECDYLEICNNGNDKFRKEILENPFENGYKEREKHHTEVFE